MHMSHASCVSLSTIHNTKQQLRRVLQPRNSPICCCCSSKSSRRIQSGKLARALVCIRRHRNTTNVRGACLLQHGGREGLCPRRPGYKQCERNDTGALSQSCVHASTYRKQPENIRMKHHTAETHKSGHAAGRPSISKHRRTCSNPSFLL